MKYEIKNRYTGAVQFTAEIDLTNNTTPFGLLGPEEQQALRDAYRAGRKIECWNWADGWFRWENYEFLSQSNVYRIREDTDA